MHPMHGLDRLSKASARAWNCQHRNSIPSRPRGLLFSGSSAAVAASCSCRPLHTADTGSPDRADGIEQPQTRRGALMTLSAAAVLVAGSSQASAIAAASPSLEQSALGLELYLKPGPHATITEQVQLPWPQSVPGAKADSIPVTIVRPAEPSAYHALAASSSSGGSGAPLAPDFVQPAAVSQQPLVVFCPGFLVDVGAYASYYDHLASWGYVVATVSLPGETALEPIADPAAAGVIAALLQSLAGGGSSDSDSDSDSDEDGKEGVGEPTMGQQSTVEPLAGGEEGAGPALMANNSSSTSSSNSPSDSMPPAMSEWQQAHTSIDVMQPAEAADTTAHTDGSAAQPQQLGRGDPREMYPMRSSIAAGDSKNDLGSSSQSNGSSSSNSTAFATLISSSSSSDKAMSASMPAEAAALQPAGGAAGDDSAGPAVHTADQEAALQAAAGAAQAAGVVLMGHSRGAKLAVLAAAALAACGSDSDSDSDSDGGEDEEGQTGEQLSTEDLQAQVPAAGAEKEGGADDEDSSSSDEETECAQVVGLGLIDPVDLTYDAPPGSPSALPALKEALQGPAPPKLLLVGAGLNSDCIPRRSNYLSFAAAAADSSKGRDQDPVAPSQDGPASAGMLVVLQQAGHLQFLDTQSTLQRSACRQGKVDEGVLRAMVAALLAWSFSPGDRGVRSQQTNPEQADQQHRLVGDTQAAQHHKALPSWMLEDVQHIQHVADDMGVAAEVRGL